MRAMEGQEVTREGILRLMKTRDDLDLQIQALGGILTSNRVGMNEPLVDDEGYPRNDIDVYQVRHARHRIICLQNDFKNITKEIDEKMVILHERLRASGGEMSMEVDQQAESNGDPPLTPIVRVNEVSEGSPAFHAGLKVDDVIVEFGSINSQNFASLSDIGTLVHRSVGNVVPVKIKREERKVQLALIPGPWSGRGLLGCNILPIDHIDR